MGTTTPAPTLTDSCPTSESLGPDNRLHPLSTGADHGIDELPVGVLVAPVDELGDGIAAIERSS